MAHAYLAYLAVSVVSPRMGNLGWPFATVDEFPGADADPLYQSAHVKDLYLRADPDYGGRSVGSLFHPEIKTNTLIDSLSPPCGTRKTRLL